MNTDLPTFDPAYQLMVAASIPPAQAQEALLALTKDAFEKGCEVGGDSTALFLTAAQTVLKRSLATDNHLRALFFQAVGPGVISAYEAWSKERGEIPVVLAWQAFFQDFFQAVTAEAETLADAEAE
jgi:hypothetical protein